MNKYKADLNKLLFAAFVIWVIGISYYITEIYVKLGAIEHAMCHMSFQGSCDAVQTVRSK